MNHGQSELIQRQKTQLFDCDTLYPRIVFYIRKADGYIVHDELVEKQLRDYLVRELAPDSMIAFRIAQKAVGLFSAHYTMERTGHGMDQYREEFTRKREDEYWAYRTKEKTR